jgi:Holliday junction resolvasome RuvABC endonuclease subunit
MTPVGLDLSLTSSGWSCGDDQRIISSRSTGPQRLYEISQDIVSLMIELDDPVAVIEGYSFASRNSQAHKIGELGGVVRLALWHLGVVCVEVPPTCRAKFATGKGNASKGEVLSSVSARTGIVWSGKGADDLCDAWVLEEMALCRLGRARFDWPVTHRDALVKVDWTGVAVAA